LSLDYNQLTGSIPPEIGNLTNLEHLNISQNNFTGITPSEIGNMSSLVELLLGYNNFSGTIPSSLFDLPNLEVLYLDNNEFSGELPEEIGNLINLYALSLHSNQLSGIIPDSICNLTGLEEINLWDNQFCPPYPECIEDYVGYQDTSNCEQVSIYDETLPITYNLYNAYPNPFNPMITIRYDVPKDELVNITIYDMMGRVVKTLVNGSQTAGYKSIIWNATNNLGEPVSAGMYIYSIQAGDFRQTKKMVLLK